jgi:(S)-mandelate dehydrogenase
MATSNAINIADLQERARARLPRVVFDYMDGGAEDETTLSANREAFKDWRLNSRLVTGHVGRDLSTTVLGQKIALPFLIGPTGLNGLHWKGADLALARAAAAAGTIFTLSTASTSSLEAVAQCTPAPKWFQLYPWGDRKVVGRLIERAKAAGYTAMMVTVDSLIAGRRERDARNNFSHEVKMTPKVVVDGLVHPGWLLNTWLAGGGMPRIENVAEFCGEKPTAHDLAEFTRSQRNAGLSWEDIAWMRAQWQGPFMVKGLACGEDVDLARKAGADGVVVSNHGGRQLDSAPGTLEVLPEVVAAAGGSMDVLIDGGFRRGSDVVKAMALGAKAVLLGRATLYGVASEGQAGVAKALDILKSETDRTLALMGCGAISELSPTWLRRRSREDAAP